MAPASRSCCARSAARCSRRRASRPPRFLALFALAALVLKLQFVDPLRENVQGTVDSFAGTTEWVLAAELDPKRVADQRVYRAERARVHDHVLLHACLDLPRPPAPRSFVPMSTAPFAHDVERIADNELRLRPLGGSFLGSPSEVHFRPLDRPLREGESVQLDGVRVTAERMRANRPQSLRLTFDRSVDDPSYVFLTATQQGLKRVAPAGAGRDRASTARRHANWAALERGRYEQRIGPLPGSASLQAGPRLRGLEATLSAHGSVGRGGRQRGKEALLRVHHEVDHACVDPARARRRSASLRTADATR